MHVQPYVFFDGRCEEALEFYRKSIGAEVTAMMRYRETPDSPPPGMLPPGSEEKIMHAEFRVGQTVILASDGCNMTAKPEFKGFSLAISTESDDDARRLFNSLSDGGQVTMPMNKTFFASSFGMLVDRFGVAWMVLAGVQ